MNNVLVSTTFAPDGIAHAINAWSLFLHTQDNYRFLWTPYGELTLRVPSTLSATTATQLVIVRLQDLAVNHPETLEPILTQKSPSKKRARTNSQTKHTYNITDQALTDAAEYLIRLVIAASSSPIIIIIVPPPPAEITPPGSPRAHLHQTLESNISNRLRHLAHVHVETSSTLTVDLMPEYSRTGYSKEQDRLSHSPYTIDARIHLAGLCYRLLLRSTVVPSFPRKVYAIDCDNTLWDGIIGEDGLDGITYGDKAPHRLWLHRWLLEQQSNGVLLCLVSKNNDSDVVTAFRQKIDGVQWLLDIDQHVVARRINWKEKYLNLVEMSKDLNLHIADFVMLDDSPVECLRARELDARNGLCVVNIPSGDQKSCELEQYVLHHWCFDSPICVNRAKETTKTEDQRMLQSSPPPSPSPSLPPSSSKTATATENSTTTTTMADRTRTQLYKQVAQRGQARRNYDALLGSDQGGEHGKRDGGDCDCDGDSNGGSNDDGNDDDDVNMLKNVKMVAHASAFLASLNLVVEFLPIDHDNVARAEQLINRTNQMQSRKMPPMKMNEILLVSEHCRLVQCRDRFGDHGIVAFVHWKVVSEKNSNVAADSLSTHLCVERFCLSCRSMNIGVEHIVMRHLAGIAQSSQCKYLSFIWRPTSRSMPMYAFLTDCGATFTVEENSVTTLHQEYNGNTNGDENDFNGIGFVEGIGLRDVFSAPVPKDLLHLSKKKQKKEMKRRYFTQKRVENPNFSMRQWRKRSREARERNDKIVQQKRPPRRNMEKVDQFMYDEKKHGKMPLSGHAIVTLDGAASAIIRPPLMEENNVQPSSASSASSAPSAPSAPSASSTSSTSPTSPTSTDEQPIRTMDSRIRSLSSVVYGQIATAYSSNEERNLFTSRMREQYALSNLDEVSKETYTKESGEEEQEEDLKRYNKRHAKRTKLRTYVKSLIQKNNEDSYLSDVKLFQLK